jgi:hypothetical protein
MDMYLKRKWAVGDATLGELFIDGEFQCFTCEDVVRPGDIFQVKVYGKTAIPAGTYEVVITFSNRFQRDLPLLLNVPNFTGIRIHPGNTAAETEGCILTGRTRDGAVVGSSRVAFSALYAKIKAARDDGENVGITITDIEEPV